jgi:hypothetical protein
MRAVKKRVLIPRKDHEVYITPISVKPGKKVLRRFAEETLEALHPGFSTASIFDICFLSFNSKTFLVITVMEKSVLSEYRLLNPHSVFFTATSLFFKPYGREKPADLELSGERVGFTEAGEPYSLPVDTPERSEEDGRVLKLLKTAKVKSAVFQKRPRFPFFAALSALVLVIVLGGIGYAAKKRNRVQPIAIPVSVKAPIPVVFRTLADISVCIAKAGGTIMRLRYDVYSKPEMVIAIQGPDVEYIFEITNKIPYLVLSNISDVRYVEKKAQYDAAFMFHYDDYAPPHPYIPEDGGAVLAVHSSVRAGIMEGGVSIISETLPVRENGFASVINFTGGRKATAAAFSFMERELPKNGMNITRMDFSFESGRFDVLITFIPVAAAEYTPLVQDWTDTLMAAFDAVEEPPPAPPPRPVVQKVNKDREGYVKIGVIRGDDGSYVYYRTKEGKIVVESE